MGCNIDKMLIKGIRSFSPDNQNVIEFYKPLTLIVGHNGAGKTTVIECLKMACTGELPPNTRSGQSFIHDPKVAGETEVKAQIKLRFMTSTRQPVVIIRSFQLTQKKSTMQFKALDNVLQTINRETGQKEALSYRCADIDRIVPQLMGVSKAVLENVIFVHQEDSNWPLAEGQVLKKKFDDIFAATKYTKALEALRKLRTEKGQEVKELRLKLENTKTLKDQAQRLRTQIESGSKLARKLEEDIQKLEAESGAAEQRRNELGGQLDRIEDFAEDLTRLRAQHTMQVKQNAEAYNRLLSMYEEDDVGICYEDLLEWNQTLEPDLHTSAAELKKVQREIQTTSIEVEAGKEQYTRDVKNQGRLAAEAEAHTRNIQDLERSLKQACTQAGVTPADGSAAAALAAFKERLAEVQRQLDSAKSANRQTDDNMGRGIDAVSAELSGQLEAQRMKREQMQRNNSKVSQLQAQFEHLIVNTLMVEAARQQEQDMAAALENKQSQLGNSKHEDSVRACLAELARIQVQISEKRQERDQLSSKAEGASRLRFKLQDLGQKQQQLESLLMGRKPRLVALLGGALNGELPPYDQLRGKVEQALAERRRAVEGYGASLKDVQAKLATTEGILNATRRQRDAAQQEQARLQRQLQDGLAAADGGGGGGAASGSSRAAAVATAAAAAPASVLDRAKQLEAAQEEVSQQVVQCNAFLSLGKSFKQNALDHNLCLTCRRPFASEGERRAFISHQEQETAQLPSALERLKQELGAAAEKLNRLRALQPTAVRHDALTSKDIPDVQRRIAALEQQAQAQQQELQDVQEGLAAAEAELMDGRKLLEEVAWPVDRLAKEIKERETEVASMHSAAAATGAAIRTVGEVDEELDELERGKVRKEAERDEAQRRHNKLRDEVADLRGEYHKAREESLRLGATAEKRAAIEAQIKELEALNQQLQAQIEAGQRERQPLEERKRALMGEREAKRRDMQAREAELEGRLRQLHTADTQLAAKQRAIDEYVAMGKAEALRRVNAALEALRQRQEQGEAAIKGLQEQLRAMETQQQHAAETKRQVDDLLAYHRGKAKEGELAAQLDTVDAAQATVGDKGAIQQEFTGLEGKLQKLRTERDMLKGSLATIQERVAACRRERDVAEYHGIEAKYKMQLIEEKTTAMANNDLEKYHKALERALLSFHTSKMADINQIVKELWQKTYRNSDIDYIQIKADQEGAAGRSYNYRVVMNTGGAELDMRGRCSAGQKVLACLIIRLALAETFCLNCGILALDEPTTNLDADNSASLAGALRSIMLARRDQENFQLVVITHDEQFARLIGTHEHAEFMWRITKDEAQHSTITQEDIME